MHTVAVPHEAFYRDLHELEAFIRQTAETCILQSPHQHYNG